MAFKLLFSLYIVFLSAFDGFLDQDAHSISLNHEISIETEKSGTVLVSNFYEHKQEKEKDKNCPNPENCHNCHQCLGHCGALFSSFSIEVANFPDSVFSAFSETLVSRDLESLFRPPIFS